jgi:hypothetical protein
MKLIKKDKTYSKNYGPTIVWLDDLATIFRLLEGSQIDISTDDYKFESLEDAQQHFGPHSIHSLKISSLKPSAQVEFSRHQTQTYVFASPTSLQLFHELDAILRKCERRPPIFYRYGIVFLGSLLPTGVGWFWEPKLFGIPVFLGPQLLWTIWMARVLFIDMRLHSVVTFKHRHEVPSFLTRNRDSLAIAIISAVIGGLVTIGGTKMKEVLFPPTPSVNSLVQEPR